MEGILEIGKYIIPSLVVLLTVWLVLTQFFKNWEAQRNQNQRIQVQKEILPIRLQAYERISLFLERISIEKLLIRETEQLATVRTLHQKLVSSIRTEYDHNISQQIYVSDEAWKVVQMAKENGIKLINTAAQSLNPEDPALELSKTILTLQMQATASPTQIALQIVKAEVRKLF